MGCIVSDLNVFNGGKFIRSPDKCSLRKERARDNEGFESHQKPFHFHSLCPHTNLSAVSHV